MTQYFTTRDGLSLYYEAHSVKNRKAAIILLHGINEHLARYSHVVSFFNQQGFSVYLYDQRGHGKSEGIRVDSPSLEYNVEDLKTFFELVQKKETKIFLLAHSFGGQVAVNFLAKYPKQLLAVALSSPNLGLTHPVSLLKFYAAKFAANFIPSFHITNEIDVKYVCRDPKVVEAYVADPLVLRKVSLRLATSMIANHAIILALAEKIKDPLFMMHAGADEICDPEISKKFYQKLKIKDKKLKIYEDDYHEILNDYHQKEVMNDVSDWFNSHL